MELVTLNNGQKMPIIGTGTNTYGKVNNDYRAELNNDFSALANAINLGYRSIDTAISYRNEAGVGKTVANSGVPRNAFFITTKIPVREEFIANQDRVHKTIKNSLENLQTDYIDLYLLHYPIKNRKQFKETWEVLEYYHNNGALKSIGVSNFDIDDLENLERFANVKPAVNQIQINLLEPNNHLVDKVKEKDITPVAWGPMKASESQKDVLKKIGESYQKTWAQILLRYQIQRKIVVIPKSHNIKNQADNLKLFDFRLSNKEMLQINNL